MLSTTATTSGTTLQHVLAGSASVVSVLLKTAMSLLFITIFTIVAIGVYRLFLHPLSSIPGPRLAALSNAWHAYHVRNGRMYELGRSLHSRYGPVVRVGPGEVWVGSREAFKRVYGAGNGFGKSEFYLATLLSKPTLSLSTAGPRGVLGMEVQTQDTLDLLSERDMSRYRLQRRLIGPVYQTSSLKKFEPAIDEVLDRAVAQLKSMKGEEVDLKMWMHIIAVECLGAVVLGWSPGYITAKSDGGTSGQGYRGWKRKSVFGLFPLITKLGFLEGKLGERFGKAVQRWWADIWGVTFPTPKNFKPFFTPVYQKSSKRISAALKGQVQDPKAKPSKKNKQSKAAEKPKDLLDDLIALHLSKPDLFTETYLRRMATTNFGAGHETLCSALTACMAMIGTHGEVQERVREEVASYLGNKDGDEKVVPHVPFDATAKELRYTLAAIKEAQRLHPVIAMSLSRTVPLMRSHAFGEGVRINGYNIPPGTTVGCNPVALHRNTEIFGEDADEYNPGRWLPRSSNSGSGSGSGSPAANSDSDSDPGSDPNNNSPQTSSSEEDNERKRLREMLHLNLTYGGGARTCPGRHLAELIVWKVVPRLVSEFRIEVTHMPDEKDMERYFMSMLTGVKVRFWQRKETEKKEVDF
ncbi:cytochrome P450 [Sordaria brevicollis]|uniref:Cytochrome P450 n=1 Tax=Sordaria brevicollis TaxID=83679 RepID=A0AAE0PI90_SORBR|nr:cytochrome P450 [Sordaria brevicollis]